MQCHHNTSNYISDASKTVIKGEALMSGARGKSKAALRWPDVALSHMLCHTGKTPFSLWLFVKKKKIIIILGVPNPFLQWSQPHKHISMLSARFKFSSHLKPTGLGAGGSCEPTENVLPWTRWSKAIYQPVIRKPWNLATSIVGLVTTTQDSTTTTP